MELGIITDCLKSKNLEEALVLAGKLKITGVQIYATTGEFSPDSLTDKSRAFYKELLKKNCLAVSALCGDMGGFGFEKSEDNPERIIKTKNIVDLAVCFGAKVVTTHIGVIPEDKNEERYRIMLEALTECGLYALDKGVTLAIETGPEKAETLKSFIKDTLGGIGVNFDPANFTMVTGQDVVEAVYLLREYIVHTHVKDGKMLNSNINPTEVYHAFALGGIEALNACKGFKELPIGQGDVDWDLYLAALKDIGYNGYLTIEREAGDNPVKDIKSAVSFIKKKI